MMNANPFITTRKYEIGGSLRSKGPWIVEKHRVDKN
jgi:hypothetical protein